MTRRGAGGCYEQGRGRKEEGGEGTARRLRRKRRSIKGERYPEGKKLPPRTEDTPQSLGRESPRLGQGCGAAGVCLVLNLIETIWFNRTRE